MNDRSKSRPISRLGLVAYLNDELRHLEKSKAMCCGCRVVNISVQIETSGVSWRPDFLENRCDKDCLALVQGIIGELRCDFVGPE